MIFAVLFLAGNVFAEWGHPCAADAWVDNYVQYQRVGIFTDEGISTNTFAFVYKSTEKRDDNLNYRVCWTHIQKTEISNNDPDYNLYTVYDSDKTEYKYMFWYEDGKKYYFNM